MQNDLFCVPQSGGENIQMKRLAPSGFDSFFCSALAVFSFVLFILIEMKICLNHSFLLVLFVLIEKKSA